ncbi:uncharacterized protein [Physcomitrium patens]|uniref:uncharacterized protein n=1 Tax=Physcomitrium patens TaxID=3218 RepID=UPI000D172163|nr:uncharacterized protein LOC112289915 [Physcomitrium patens]|eukprot:XP_024391420.1 uncharacterized protein LOC112289915 [Physcomitrella patens]
MPRLYESLKHQALVQLRSGVSTRKVVDSLGMNQTSVAHLRREISSEIEKQRGGRPKVLGEQKKRLGVHLVTAGCLKTASAAAKQLREKTAISAPSMASSISRFESNGTFLGPSQTVFKPSHSKAKRCSRIVGECL